MPLLADLNLVFEDDMVNIAIFSDNEDFKNDLTLQISRFVEDADICSDKPDIIIVDENKELFKQKRAEYQFVPMLFLTADSLLDNDNLNVYVHKPFKLMNFLDVVRAANNKLDNSAAGFLRFSGYELRPNQKEIADLENDEVIKLTEKEVSIIKYLYKEKNEFVSKNDLQTNVWQYNENATTHTVETHIYRLRQKVERGARRLIVTEGGKYKLNMD